jgi:hypothetical protein
MSRKFGSFSYRKLPGHKTDLNKIEPPYGMLSLKQQVQTTEKDY